MVLKTFLLYTGLLKKMFFIKIIFSHFSIEEILYVAQVASESATWRHLLFACRGRQQRVIVFWNTPSSGVQNETRKGSWTLSFMMTAK